MLIHIVPRLYASPVDEPLGELVDFECRELGLKLQGHRDVVARRPYKNKNYLVACRHIGRKAVDGFFVETTARLQEFTGVTRWSIGAERVVTHRVLYRILDAEMDAVSESMACWHAHSGFLGGYAARWPEGTLGIPAKEQPRMELAVRDRAGSFTDQVDANGRILERSEILAMHTLEYERIVSPKGIGSMFPMPDRATAFRAAI